MKTFAYMLVIPEESGQPAVTALLMSVLALEANLTMLLHGIKAVALATAVAAPTTSHMLFAHGADLIKVESLSGDEMRHAGSLPFTPTCALGDMSASSVFLSGILMALLGRVQTGKGAFVPR